jgi:hypothetical protein
MIEEVEGATSEPPRRRHVIVLSAVAATASLVVLLTLLATAPRIDTERLGASVAPSATVGTVIASTRVSSETRSSVTDSVTLTECAAGIGSSPPVHLVLDGTGRAIAAYSSGRTGRFVPLPPGYVASGGLTVPCDTPDVFAPRISRVR